jgi:putative PEP-CTERM system TPR-repeat lipoprotein
MVALLLMALAACSNDTPQSLIASGQEYTAKKDHKAAAIQFKTALQLDPQSAQARFLLGQALLLAGDPHAAVLELSKAMDQKYAPDQVVPALARALLLSGDYKKLTTLYGDVVLQDKAAQASLKSSLATAWGAQGDRARTEAAIAAALAASPDYGPALVLSARLMAGRRDFKGALALLDQVLARDAMLYEAWHLKGEIVQLASNDKQGATEAYRKALAIEPAYMPSHLALISNALRDHDIPAAKAQADALRTLMPKHPQIVFVDANVAFAERAFAKAREMSQQLLRVAPAHVGVLQLAGAIEGQLGSLVLAETHFAKALQIQPDLPMARRNLAQVYLRLGQATKSLETLKPLLGAEAANPDALALAGEAELRLGNAEAAEAYFNRAAKLSPDNVQVRTALALGHLSRGDPNTAFAELATLAAASKDTFTDQAIVAARMKRREYDAALLAVDAMAKKQPDNASVLELRGRVQIARKDYPAARQAFEQALKLEPQLFAATASLAALDVLEKKPEQARQRLEAAVKADPRNPYAVMALAELRSRADAPVEEVKALLAEAIKLAPSDATPRLQLIELTLRKRQYKEALVAAQEAAAALPNDLKVLDAVGRAQMEAGDVEQSVSTFRRMAGIDQNSALAYVRLADVFIAAGKRSSAEAVLKQALEIEPDLSAAQVALVELLFKDKRSREAIEYTRKVQTKRTKSSAGFLLEGALQQRLKSSDAAVAAYRAGLARFPADSELARNLYKVLLASGRNAEADPFGANWMKAHPADSAFDYQIALNHIARGELDPAQKRLTAIVARHPNHPLALNNLAWVLVVRGQPGAVAHAQKATELMPENPALMDTLAMALAADKQFDKALALQKRVVDLAPQQHALRLNLAKIAIQAGDKPLARKELEKLQALGRTFPFQDEVANLLKTL